MFAEHHGREVDVGGGVLLPQLLECPVAEQRGRQVLVNPARSQGSSRDVRDERDVLLDLLPAGDVAVGQFGTFLDEPVDGPAPGDVGGGERVGPHDPEQPGQPFPAEVAEALEPRHHTTRGAVVAGGFGLGSDPDPFGAFLFRKLASGHPGQVGGEVLDGAVRVTAVVPGELVHHAFDQVVVKIQASGFLAGGVQSRAIGVLAAVGSCPGGAVRQVVEPGRSLGPGDAPGRLGDGGDVDAAPVHILGCSGCGFPRHGQKLFATT